jgi:hypothetical protein
VRNEVWTLLRWMNADSDQGREPRAARVDAGSYSNSCLDVWNAVAALADLAGRLPAMQACLGATTLPEVEPGSQCNSPYPREFWDPARRTSRTTGFPVCCVCHKEMT